jgi:hypothetical protein
MSLMNVPGVPPGLVFHHSLLIWTDDWYDSSKSLPFLCRGATNGAACAPNNMSPGFIDQAGLIQQVNLTFPDVVMDNGGPFLGRDTLMGPRFSSALFNTVGMFKSNSHDFFGDTARHIATPAAPPSTSAAPTRAALVRVPSRRVR